jgi:hypothetical protein
MAHSRLLNLERLEERWTPATSGVTWPDGQHLTLSFVPDGTPLGNTTSSLFKTLNAVAPTAVWQREILRAFQAWAGNVNVNVGVVPDGGQPLGTGGAVQGDAKFGDVRIAAAAMPANTLITNTAFQWSGTTWSGDMVVNSTNLFSIGGKKGYDLYTAMLNEAGNVLGVLDSHTDTASGVYYQYVGVKTGLDANDLADVQSLYGARSSDAYDAAGANGTIGSATNLGIPLGGVSLQADMTSPTDVDYYKVTLPVLSPGVVGLTVKVTTTGLSSLTPTLQVYDAAKNLVASASDADPLTGDLTVQVKGGLLSVLTQLLGGSSYTIRVAGNSGTGFGVGGYQLDVAYSLADGTVLSLVGGLTSPLGLGGLLQSVETGANDLVTSALTLPSHLTNGAKPDARFDYTYKASISSSSDVDYYKVQAPSVAAGPQKMNVLVWADPSRLVPRVDVFDASGNPVAATLLANENGTFSVEVPNATAGATYYVKVSALNPSGSHNVGNYFLGVDYTTQPVTALQNYVGDTLTKSAPQQTRTLTVGQNRLYEFILSASAASAAEVRMDVFNAAGNLVFSLRSYAGDPAASGHVYLAAGTYTVRFSASAPSGSQLPNVAFVLMGRVISDPIGPRTDDGSCTAAPQQGDSWSGPSDSANASGSGWDTPYYF